MKRILVVEDELDIAEALQALLEAEGYAVRTCSDGVRCLEALERETPDLVLLDIMMPRLDGFGVLDAIAARDYAVPVLLMSAVHPARRLEPYRRLIEDFIQKPFELDVLLDRVAALVHKR